MNKKIKSRFFENKIFNRVEEKILYQNEETVLYQKIAFKKKSIHKYYVILTKTNRSSQEHAGL